MSWRDNFNYVSKSFMRRRKLECIHENVFKKICGWIWFQFLVTSMLNSQKNNVGRSADEILRDVSDVLDFRDCKAFLKVGIPAYLHEQQFLGLTIWFLCDRLICLSLWLHCTVFTIRGVFQGFPYLVLNLFVCMHCYRYNFYVISLCVSTILWNHTYSANVHGLLKLCWFVGM